MNKNVKNILMIGGVAIIGYVLYKKYGKKSSMPTFKPNDNKESNFSYASGTRKIRSGGGGSCSEGSPTCNLCGESCINGQCYVSVYDENGNVTYRTARCTGTGFGQISKGKR